jgi:hypothetical protein
MRSSRLLRLAMAAAWLCGSGCTTLKEIPRTEYAARPERRQVRVFTTDSLEYEFDTAKIQGDTLIGTWRRDVGGPIEEFDSLALPLDRVARLTARRIDWYRTGLIGGISLAAVIAAGLSGRNANGSPNPDPGPCPREPCN